MTATPHTAATRRNVAVCLLFGFLLLPSSFAQVSTRISSIGPSDAVSGSPVTLRAELRQGELVERAFLFYRPFAESEWRSLEMELRGNTAIGRIPASAVLPPYIDYYIVLQNRNGTVEAYPFNDSPDPLRRPPGRLVQLPVINREEDQQIMFLSPDEDAMLEAQDVVISASLLRADTTVVKRATQVILDGVNVSQHIMIAEDIVVYVPDNHGVILKPGRHRVTIALYDRQGNLHRQVSLSFYVTGEGEKIEAGISPFLYSGSIDAESRFEKVSNVRTWYNRAGMRFTGSQGDWRFVANAFFTTDEKFNRQPQNRYYAGLESRWLLVGYGDNYPSFPDLILNGKRVRGINSSLRLGKFNIDMTLGRTIRAIEGSLVKTIPVTNLEEEQRNDPFAAFARIDSQTWGKYDYGTYARDLFAIRPSFGSGETYQIGFTWLKAKDKIGSIRFGNKPQENLVIGTDMVSRFDENRIELTAQGAFSAYNSDISSGNFTDAYIDSVYKKDAATIKDARDILKNFITVNDNLRPLSFKRLSTLAYDLGITLNYFSNTFKAAYTYRGSDYTSFGQTFLRKDIAGFSLMDRIRLVAQNLFITLGYERLTDNTSKTKASTTRFTTINAAVTFDSRGDLPSVSVGYTRFANANDLMTSGPDSISAVDDQTNRIYLYFSHRFTWHASHLASFTFSSSQRNDYTVRNLDVKNMSAGVTLISRYDSPVQTSIGFTTSTNEFPSAGARARINYSSVFAQAQYTVGDNLGTLGVTASPTFGDIRRLSLDMVAQWNILPSMNVILQYSYFNNDGGPNDDFWSLKYHFDY